MTLSQENSEQKAEENKEQKKRPILLIILLVTLLAVASAYCAVTFKKPDTSNEISGNKNEFIVFDYDEQKLKNAEQKEKAKLEQLIDANEQESNMEMDNLLSQVPVEDNKVSLNIRTGGRSNPFKPYTERSLTGGGSFDLVEPPEYIPDEPVAEDLMQTTVSGILYNAQKSSAIINVDGTDQLVNKGDKIAGFQIVNITKNKVYVKKGTNTIAAGVGESIEEPALTYNSVYNLPKKFGGYYGSPKKGVILINGKEY